MRRIIAIEAGGASGTDHVRLDFAMRNRRRIVLTSAGGAALLLDQARAVHLRDGDVLVLDDGARIAVRAADEALIEITAPGPAELVRIAWHLGNRHLPTQLVPGPPDSKGGGAIRIRHDHVIAEMAVGLGGHCHAISAPFDPEGGAYAGGGAAHSHDHHDHHHEHAHG